MPLKRRPGRRRFAASLELRTLRARLTSVPCSLAPEGRPSSSPSSPSPADLPVPSSELLAGWSSGREVSDRFQPSQWDPPPLHERPNAVDAAPPTTSSSCPANHSRASRSPLWVRAHLAVPLRRSLPSAFWFRRLTQAARALPVPRDRPCSSVLVSDLFLICHFRQFASSHPQ